MPPRSKHARARASGRPALQELWALLHSATTSASGIPARFEEEERARLAQASAAHAAQQARAPATLSAWLTQAQHSQPGACSWLASYEHAQYCCESDTVPATISPAILLLLGLLKQIIGRHCCRPSSMQRGSDSAYPSVTGLIVAATGRQRMTAPPAAHRRTHATLAQTHASLPHGSISTTNMTTHVDMTIGIGTAAVATGPRPSATMAGATIMTQGRRRGRRRAGMSGCGTTKHRARRRGPLTSVAMTRTQLVMTWRGRSTRGGSARGLWQMAKKMATSATSTIARTGRYVLLAFSMTSVCICLNAQKEALFGLCLVTLRHGAVAACVRSCEHSPASSAAVLQPKPHKEHKKHREHKSKERKEHRRHKKHSSSRHDDIDTATAHPGSPAARHRHVDATENGRHELADAPARSERKRAHANGAERGDEGGQKDDLNALRQQARRAKARSLSSELRKTNDPDGSDLELVLE